MKPRRLTKMLTDEMLSHPRWDDFLEFHDRNPQVFEWLLDEAQKAVRKGYRLLRAIPVRCEVPVPPPAQVPLHLVARVELPTGYQALCEAQSH